MKFLRNIFWQSTDLMQNGRGLLLFFGIVLMSTSAHLYAPGTPGPVATAGTTAAEEDMALKLSDADIKALGLSESEAAELRQFFDAVNNLPAAEKKQIKDLASETETKMRAKNLDPNNFDDLVKFMEEQEKEAKGIKEQPAAVPTVEEAKPAEKAPVVYVASPKDTLTLLRDIERKIESLLVKVKSRESLNRKMLSMQLEISELRYFIKVLQSPDLVLLLASKEFEKLHKNLETLHKALATHEPSIIARKRVGDDDPYEILEIEYTATPEQITAAYKRLKNTKSPEAVKKILKEKGFTEKESKKKIKEARLTWRFIQEAYDLLNDPKERALIRKELKNKIDAEARNDRASRAAFDRLFDAFTTAFYPQGMLKDIRGLLEKHKPQELEAAKKELEKEKAAAERAKKVTRIETTPMRPAFGETQPYKEFYEKMAQESYMRPQYPTPPSYAGAKPAGEPSEKAGAAAEGKKEEPKKKEGKKEEKEKKEEKGKEKEGEEKIEKKELPKYAALDTVERILKGAKKSIKVKDEEGKEEELDLADILENFKTNIKSGGADEEGIQQLMLFATENQFEMLFEALKTLAPDEKNKLNEAFCGEWKKRIWTPYGALLEKWHEEIYGRLLGQRFVKKHGKWNEQKAKKYMLDKAEPDKTALSTKKWKAPKMASKKEINLGALRDITNGIHIYSQAINKECKLGKAPAKKEERKKAKAPKKKKPAKAPEAEEAAEEEEAEEAEAPEEAAPEAEAEAAGAPEPLEARAAEPPATPEPLEAR